MSYSAQIPYIWYLQKTSHLYDDNPLEIRYLYQIRDVISRLVVCHRDGDTLYRNLRYNLIYLFIHNPTKIIIAIL